MGRTRRFWPGMDDRAGHPVQVPQLAQAHLVQAGDLGQVVALLDLVDRCPPGRGRAEPQFLAGVDPVGFQAVEALQLVHGYAVALGDLPQGVAAFDDVHGLAARPCSRSFWPT